MVDWILVSCLVSLREEFNQLAPDRDKSSDGSIGDDAHASSSSDHNPDETGATPYEDADSVNEVHAIDVDVNLRVPGWTMERAVQIIVDRHRLGSDDRLQNVIYNRRVWSRSWGWTEREYTGSNPHDKHAHFSSRYTTPEESDTRPWGLLEEDEMDFWASAAKAARGDADATATDRNNRNNAVQVIRFALGLQVDDQTGTNLPSGPDGQLARIEAALKPASVFDSSAETPSYPETPGQTSGQVPSQGTTSVFDGSAQPAGQVAADQQEEDQYRNGHQG